MATPKKPARPPAKPKSPRSAAKSTGKPKPAPTVDKQHDCGPWIEAPRSTRVSRYRYDYGEGELQVSWMNGRGHVNTTYKIAEGVSHTLGGISYDEQGNAVVTGATARSSVAHRGDATYRKFAMAVSKGKYVNSTLNGFMYWPSTPDELDAPSNPNRKAVARREKNASIDWQE